MEQLRVQELAEWLADASRPRPLLLDVREAWEVELCRIEGSQHMPMRTVPAHCEELDPEREIVTICHHGVRSQQVALFLEHQGFAKIFNLTGGVEAWACEVEPGMRRY